MEIITKKTNFEIILCSNNSAKITGKRIGSVWSISKDNANDYVHATQKAEIARVEKALAETKSEYLKRDYNKYLKKLYKRLRVEVNG